MKVASALALGLFGLSCPAMAGESPAQWFSDGQTLVAERVAQNPPKAPARNIILFVGDGMSLTTVSAARILEGQQRGLSGEENLLFFERFKHVALAKTYNTNQQTPDSAGTMTAMATGVKSYAGAIGVDQTSNRGDCKSVRGAERVSLIDLATLAGLSTGIVTTTRITHATPAALYAKSPDRRWESDRGLPPTAKEQGCLDIADQLISYPVGDGIDLVMGGGRRAFYPSQTPDPEYPEILGHRTDDRNLLEEWQAKNSDGRFVWNQAGFEELNSSFEGPILALFEPDHMQYEFDRSNDPAGEPSLTDMVSKAIEILEARSTEGFLLVVESGRIDHAHHANNAWRALTDTIEFSNAIQAAVSQVNTDETLIIVTADHAHALTFDGYGARGNPIMGVAVRPGDGSIEERTMRDHQDRPMTVLNYANGPGYRRADAEIDFNAVDPLTPDYKQKAGTWQYSSTHAGEDVPIYATGPGSEVLFGVLEQNVIFHAMVQAQPRLKATSQKLSGTNGLPLWEAAIGHESSNPE